jgi:formylglycine-generating enzyme required for sulfatase activity
VTFNHGFELMRTPVTVAQYKACVEAQACVAADVCGDDLQGPNYGDPNALEQPIVCVDKAMAEAFGVWVGARLPSEAEWAYGARGPMESADDYHVFPWGSAALDCSRANYNYDGDPPDPDCVDGLLDVGSRSPAGDSPFGLADMAGSVWEWTKDCRGAVANYSRTPANGEATVEACGLPPHQLMLRGGPWEFDGRFQRSAKRDDRIETAQHANTGFRLARTIP